MRAFFVIVLAALGATVSSVRALPPNHRTLVGEVTEVDVPRRQLTVRTEASLQGLVFQWGPKTLFFRGGKPVNAEELNKGLNVTLRYRHPFIGPRQVTRVFIQKRNP